MIITITTIFTIFFYLRKGDPKSRVHGFIHDDIFEGRIFCGDGNEYNIDSIIQYKHLNHSADVHSVIYNAADIIPPKRHVCGGAKAETRDWMTSQTNFSLNVPGNSIIKKKKERKSSIYFLKYSYISYWQITSRSCWYYFICKLPFKFHTRFYLPNILLKDTQSTRCQLLHTDQKYTTDNAELLMPTRTSVECWSGYVAMCFRMFYCIKCLFSLFTCTNNFIFVNITDDDIYIEKLLLNF